MKNHLRRRLCAHQIGLSGLGISNGPSVDVRIGIVHDSVSRLKIQVDSVINYVRR
jgi:hypothetical protein